MSGTRKRGRCDGRRYKQGNAWKEKDADLHGSPMLSNRTKNAEQLFETSALTIKGNQEGMYYGSVQWGWRTDNKGKFSTIPFTTQSKGFPSSSFMKAAEIWNTKKSSSNEKNIPLPVSWTGTIQNNSLAALRLGKSASSNVQVFLRIQPYSIQAERINEVESVNTRSEICG